MLLHLLVLLAGCFCRSSAEEPPQQTVLQSSVATAPCPKLRPSEEPPKRTVRQNSLATLPCPHADGDVSWSRLMGGRWMTLITFKNGIEEKKTQDKRYSSLADKSLVILNATIYDSVMYCCNQKSIYLEVTTGPTVRPPKAGHEPVTLRVDGQHFVLGPGQEGGAADPENLQTSDFWKVFGGVVVGAGLVLSVVFALRLRSKKRAETTDTGVAKTEAIYAEIEGVEQRPRRESDVESPYDWACIIETQSTSTAPNDNTYSTVNKLKTKEHSSEECVYYLAQNPTQTGHVSE